MNPEKPAPTLQPMVLASPILVESLGAKKSTVVSCFRQESPPRRLRREGENMKEGFCVEPKDVGKIRREWRAKGYKTKAIPIISEGLVFIQLEKGERK